MNRHLLCAVAVALLPLSALACAAEPASTAAAVPPAVTVKTGETGEALKNCVIYVENRKLDTAGLPAPAFKKGRTVLLPLRKVADALGYTLTWLPEKRTARMDMSIASMDFQDGVSTYRRRGKLQIIDLDQTFTYGAAPEILDGVTYVPADVFAAFFNDVAVSGDTVRITVQKAGLQKAAGAFASAAEPVKKGASPDNTAERAAKEAESPAKKAEGAEEIPNPMVQYKSVRDMEKKLGWTIPVPAGLKKKPVESCWLISDETAQINYRDGSMYRVAKSSRKTTDISGDYNKYPVDRNWLAGSFRIRGRGDREAYKLLTWDANGYAHSYASAQPLTKDAATKLVLGRI